LDARDKAATVPRQQGASRYLTPRQASEAYPFLNHGTLANWRSQGRRPRYIRVGGRIVYGCSDIEEWLAASTVELSMSQAQPRVGRRRSRQLAGSCGHAVTRSVSYPQDRPVGRSTERGP
jgi:hypothetical protein